MITHLKKMLAGRILRQSSVVNAFDSLNVEVACPEFIEGPSLKARINVDWNNNPPSQGLWRDRTLRALLSGIMLIASCAGISAMDLDPRNADEIALGQAAEEGDEADVKRLIESRAQVNSVGINGVTPLILAAEYGHLRVVQILLDHGAIVNVQAANETCALSQAAANGHDAIVQLLLDKNADANMANALKSTPLMLATQFGHTKIVRQLLAAQVDPNLQDYQKMTALMYAAANGQLQICSELIKSHADVHIIENNGNTAFLYAAIFKKIPLMKELIKAGAAIDAPSGGQQGTSLINAVCKGDFEVAVFLLKNKANPNKPAIQGITPLMCAANTNQPIFCKLLMEHGADIFSENISECSAFTGAALNNNRECMQTIIGNAYFLDEIQTDASIQSNFGKLISQARDAISWLPGLSAAAPVKPSDRITTTLLCMQRLKIARDVQYLILCNLHEDIVAILIPHIKSGNNIPPFTFKLMADGIYRITRARLLPMIQKAQERVTHCMQQKLAGAPDYQWINACPENLLDIKEFDAHYGNQLRETIKARLHEFHIRKKSRYKAPPVQDRESIQLISGSDHEYDIKNFQ
jgi:ankyrin repeat protein